jgi:TolB-like protein
MVLAFGDHRLDIKRRELRRGTELIELEPKVFDLLAFLVQHRDCVVSKDDLLREIWSGRIVSESALTTRINAVRRALGDDGTAQRLVRTFTRKGIRFVGEVTEMSDPAVTFASDQPSLTPIAADKPSIAVLRFRNMTGDPEQENLVDGMVEEIITGLSRIRWLSVIARNSAFTYKDQAVDVQYLLEGSVRKAGNRVRIAAQLIDATNGAYLWADRFDGSLEDVFELQDRIAVSVVGVIEPALQAAETHRSAARSTSDPWFMDRLQTSLRLRPRVTSGAYFFKRKFDNAVSKLPLALQGQPGAPPAYRTRGTCYAPMGRLDEARLFLSGLLTAGGSV